MEGKPAHNNEKAVGYRPSTSLMLLCQILCPIMLPCRPKDDQFWSNEGISHNRHPPTEHGPLTIFWGWDIGMDGDPSAGEYSREAAPDYVPY